MKGIWGDLPKLELVKIGWGLDLKLGQHLLDYLA